MKDNIRLKIDFGKVRIIDMNTNNLDDLDSALDNFKRKLRGGK